jgi:serine/threonine-protein kinase HipA
VRAWGQMQVYRYENQKTGREESDRTMALKLNKTVRYPTRQDLHDFGRNICGVREADAVFDRISEAMTSTLVEEGARLPRDFLASYRAEWEAGIASMARLRVFGRSVTPEKPPATVGKTPNMEDDAPSPR